MIIKHFRKNDTVKIIEHYTKKDNVPIDYVCTTDLERSDVPVDIFYRETPHPEFGNKYFGIYNSSEGLMVCNADKVEDFTFGMVEDDEGDLQYSQSHHDYKSFNNGNMIDGGRIYIRHSGKIKIYVVRDGKMLEQTLTTSQA